MFHDEETGDDYQIALHLSAGGFYDQMHKLVYAFCPKDPEPLNPQVRPLIQILYHASPPEKNIQQGVEFPRFAIPLGTLTVRSTFRRREAEIITDLRPDTEWTDYQVLLDAEREAMPLWILCSRRTLRERRQALLEDNLPVFGGFMQFEEYGYDAAWILDSVHRLRGEHRLNYRNARELVERTRSLFDPVRSNAAMEKLEELVGGPVPDTAGQRHKGYGPEASSIISKAKFTSGPLTRSLLLNRHEDSSVSHCIEERENNTPEPD